ncbi:type I polyketide synthase [Ottowia thiooxydans]|uniref:type I polyketide synthase n=1 Tax=Ottowia thiooxydans TaxID=219182 RepID=UPI0004275449|nr:type I polyketide synthase [Ottowia thiooxydans]
MSPCPTHIEVKAMDCIALIPPHTALQAVKAVHAAGGIPLLDGTGLPSDDIKSLVERLGRPIGSADPTRSTLGLRIDAADALQLERWLDSTDCFLVLSQWTARELPALLERLGGCRTWSADSENGPQRGQFSRDLQAHSLAMGQKDREKWTAAAHLQPAISKSDSLLGAPIRPIWLELTSRGDIGTVSPALPFAGWLARGAESAGRCGEESAFIFCQHLAKQDKPFWIQGGIGVHSAVACQVGGASGVVLDDALLLLREFSPPASWQSVLGKQRMEDTRVLVNGSGERYRVAAGHRFSHPVMGQRQIGWGDPTTFDWPLGQMAGQAHRIASRYGSMGHLMAAIRAACRRDVALAAALQPLAQNGPLARAHGTAFPIVQGPMTRVSDGAAFAEAVAEAGGLPMVALSVMQPDRVATLLKETRIRLAGKPWGAGLLGYLPAELLEAQLEAVAECRPAFAVVAGGSAEQGARLESLGIPTYIHVPTPSLLALAWEQGARRFVFEGSECGGHVGPLYSLPLWNAMIDALLQLPKGQHADVLFAGGIHDERSAAMVAAMAAPLAARGIRIGVLMGSAYLFTREAVATGAIADLFQQQALESSRTVLIETRPGHRVRCAPTPFTQSFDQRRSALLAAGEPPGAVGDQLEELLQGRLRIASKGIIRHGDELRQVDSAQMMHEGAFMMGEVVGLNEARISCAELHHRVADGAMRLLGSLQEPLGAPLKDEDMNNEPVAIIGIGCVLPGAQEASALWRNLLDQANAIREVPESRWDWRLYFDGDPKARDRIYSKWGGFIDALPFDPLGYGIPPKSLQSISLAQLLALETTRRALEDAGLGNLSDHAALREQTSVIFGVASTGDLELMYKARSALPLITPMTEEAQQRLPEWTEESYPGILLNVVAGRIANRFDLGGCNFVVDAACASSLAALDLAVRELQSHRSDMVLAGAVETELSPHAYMAFSKTQALSGRGEANVFDARADGIVISEGAVTLVLKRLSDAERDGDRVYALIRAVAGSSDGRGMGLTAPKPAGQVKAVQRAHRAGGTQVNAMGLYEAHGTGTRVGDQAELESLISVLSGSGAGANSCVVGSAKSLLGHTRAAAGLTGVVKAALALHHRTLPPHGGVKTPLAALLQTDSPAFLLDRPLPWFKPEGKARQAGVSAFGFGGTNFHAVLEEHGTGAMGADAWPLELFAFKATDRGRLAERLNQLATTLVNTDDTVRLRDLSRASFARATSDAGRMRLALVATSKSDLQRQLAAAAGWLQSSGSKPPPGIYAGSAEGPAEQEGSPLAFLFPGQGSQFPGMGAELAVYFAEVGDALHHSDVRGLILPPAAFDESSRQSQEKQLADTRVAQPAIAALSAGMLDLARRCGLAPERVAGHSFGEFVALHAAGALSRDDLLKLAAERGRLMGEAGSGTMLMAGLGLDALKPFLADRDGKNDSEGVWIANLNSPTQTVLSGDTQSLAALCSRLEAAGHVARPLPVSAAFHSPLMRGAAEPFAGFLAQEVRFMQPKWPVHANLDGQPYPEDVDGVRQRCSEHLEQSVNFSAQITSMWEAGVRHFLEIGPGRVLTGLVGQILGDRPHKAVASEGSLKSWLSALGSLWAAGQPVALDALFQEREVRTLDLEKLPTAKQHAWMLDGGRIYQPGQPALVGVTPFRDALSPASAPATLATAPSALGADPVADAFGQYQETMRQFLDQQERMMMRVLDGHSSPQSQSQHHPAQVASPAPQRAVDTTHANAGDAPPAQDAAAPSLKPVQVTIDGDRLRQDLVRLVSERTGYPVEMLGLEQDLEGELGIDSIKRIEIINNLVKSLPAEVSGQLRKQLNRLVQAKSLKAIVESVLQQTESRLFDPIAVDTGGPGCPRFLMVDRVKPLPTRLPKPASGLWVITSDNGDVARQLLGKFHAEGLGACLIPHEELNSPELIVRRLTAQRYVHGPVAGIVHLAALGSPAQADDLAAWRDATARVVKSLHVLLQACAQELTDPGHPMRLLAASQSGGVLDIEHPEGNTAAWSAAGGCHGLLRSVEQEFPHLLTKVVDVEPSSSGLVELLFAEASLPGGGTEIAYRAGERFIRVPQQAPWPTDAPADDRWRPQAGWVVLATGGARGITAEICRELAAPGVRLVLVGRSAAQDTSAGQERETSMASFRAAGAEVEYYSLDVRDEAAMTHLINDLYERYGRIDAVVHGAGLIEDQSFLAKEPESFDRVFDTKADSAYLLSHLLRPAELKWMVLFGSISGRFGNQGQSDYAAANQVMARLGTHLDQRWPSTRVVTIDWGPWQGAGMAADGVLALLEGQGITPVSIAAGRRFFVEEMSRGRKGESEVIAGNGPWALEIDRLLSTVFELSLLLLHGEAHAG